MTGSQETCLVNKGEKLNMKPRLQAQGQGEICGKDKESKESDVLCIWDYC